MKKEKLIVYKDNENAVYHYQDNDNCEARQIPFGLIAWNFLNTLLSLETPEKYAEYEQYLTETHCPIVLASGKYDALKPIYEAMKDRLAELQAVFADFGKKSPAEKYDIFCSFQTLLYEAEYFQRNGKLPSKKDIDTFFETVNMQNINYVGSGFIKKQNTETQETLSLCRCDMYEVNSLNYLFSMDLSEAIAESYYNVGLCGNCGRLQILRTGKQKYCDCCQHFRTKTTYAQNKKNEARLLHTHILTHYRNTKRLQGVSSDPFRLESNYYWSIIQGKQPKTPRLDTYKDITTEKQYMQWLEKFFADLKTK